jgi:dihydrofolate reductase
MDESTKPERRTTMKKLIVTMWTTLDGFIADRNNDMNWVLGDDEMMEYELNLLSNADTLLFGRKTYEDFAGAWPHVPSNPEASAWEKTIANKINALHKVVLSRTLKKAEWNDTTIMHDLIPEEIEKLKGESAKGILIYGSANIVQQLTNLGLIDECQLLVHPVVLGGGKPLFQDKANLKLVKAEPFQSGVMLLTYQLAKK